MEANSSASASLPVTAAITLWENLYGLAVDAMTVGVLSPVSATYFLYTQEATPVCVYKKYVAETGDKTPTVIASTASPYKFSHSVMAAVTGKEAEADEFASIDALCKASGVAIPRAVEEIRNAEIRHNRECDAADMEKTVAEILGL